MTHAYSTGPMENTGSNRSALVFTKVLNNDHCRPVQATIRVFGLNGTKTLIDTVTLAIGPLASNYHTTDVSLTPEFEVEVAIFPRKAAEDVLVGVFGKLDSGDLNPSHRLVHREMTPIDDLCFPFDDPGAVSVGRR